MVSMRATSSGSPLHGGVDRNRTTTTASACWRRSPLHGGVDRNRPASPMTAPPPRVAPSRGRGSKLAGEKGQPMTKGSPLHGGVDRNPRLRCRAASASRGRPFTGAWIETRSAARPCPGRCGSPLHGGVDRNLMLTNIVFSPIRGRPFTGAWIETRPCASPSLRRSVAPSRGRGSKHDQVEVVDVAFGSPLHGGVDRNTWETSLNNAVWEVAPSRGRGSKP